MKRRFFYKLLRHLWYVGDLVHRDLVVFNYNSICILRAGSSQLLNKFLIFVCIWFLKFIYYSFLIIIFKCGKSVNEGSMCGKMKSPLCLRTKPAPFVSVGIIHSSKAAFR